MHIFAPSLTVSVASAVTAAEEEKRKDTGGMPPIFIVSLAQSTDRREKISERLDALGLDYKFFDAIDGATLDIATLPDYEGRKRRLFFGRDMSAGEIGCLLSHRAIYSHLVEQNIPAAVVLEDDSLLEDDLPEVLPALAALPVEWDLIRFIGRDKIYRKSKRLGPVHGPYHLTRLSGTPGGAYGYMLKQSGARKLLAAMKKNWLPVDTMQGQTLRTGLKSFGLAPSPVLPEFYSISIIGKERFDKTVRLSGWEKNVYPATRLAFKLFDMAQKYLPLLYEWKTDRDVKKRLGGFSRPEKKR